ncbi:MAG: phosphatase PAP2 family protein [Alphaproteobacteria bacterium]|nr:phosphatase PAP2 family protein [Alphaproteobacteria bacterium]
MRLFYFRPAAFKVPLVFAVPAIAFLLLLAIFPEWDLVVSGWFYDPERGGFYMGKNFWIDWSGYFTSMASAIFVLGCFLFYGLGKVKRRTYIGMDKRLAAYFGLVLVIGPLLLVSLGFKEFWGRPRPVDVTEFGGVHEFVPYYQPSNACDTDCSFPSGHSARGFFFMALAFATYGLKKSRRVSYALLTAAILFGITTGFLRIIEGMHFLTDVTISAIIVTYTAWVLFRLMWPPELTAPPTKD